MPTCITSTPFPVPPAAGLPCRLPLPLRRPGPAAAPSARAHGIPASGRGALAVPVSWPGCCRWPALPGSAPACLWWTAGHGAGGRAAAAQRLCWLVLDFKHTSPAGCRLRPGDGRPARIPAECGQGSSGRVECLATSAVLRTGLCRRSRFWENEPGLLPCPFGARRRRGVREGQDPHDSAVFRGRRCCSPRRICGGPRRRVMSSKPPQLGSESA